MYLLTRWADKRGLAFVPVECRRHRLTPIPEEGYLYRFVGDPIPVKAPRAEIEAALAGLGVDLRPHPLEIMDPASEAGVFVHFSFQAYEGQDGFWYATVNDRAGFHLHGPFESEDGARAVAEPVFQAVPELRHG